MKIKTIQFKIHGSNEASVPVLAEPLPIPLLRPLGASDLVYSHLAEETMVIRDKAMYPPNKLSSNENFRTL